MNKLNHYSHSGHCFPELVEKKDGIVITQMKSFLWKTDYLRINNQFKSLLNQPLKDGINILCFVEINYDLKYGISLKILDIDPSFTLGELEKEKLQNIATLKSLSLFDKQKQIKFPTLPKKIAIISVETSKGYADFVKIINGNKESFIFETKLFPSILQGEKATKNILRQLRNIEKSNKNFDLVAIIRGGGGEVGLASFNDLTLCKEIANFKLPVITGIGHATNTTITEQIAYFNAITPTELGNYLVYKFQKLMDVLNEKHQLIIDNSENIILTKKEIINRLINRLTQKSKLSLLLAENTIELFKVQLKNNSQNLIEFQKNRVKHKRVIIEHNDPHKILTRGYTITTKENKHIINSDIKRGDVIESLFNDKLIISKIEKITKNE